MEITKEELINMIPDEWSTVKEFVNKRNELDYYSRNDEELIIDDVTYGNRQYMIIINTKRNEIEFRDDLVDKDAVSNYIEDIDYEEWKQAFKKLEGELKTCGFKLRDAGNGGNEDYVWYGIVTDVSVFEEDNLINAIKLWNTYNSERRTKY